MRTIELWIDLDGPTLTADPARVAISIHVPDKLCLEGEKQVVVFAVPGSGYSRKYFDIRVGDLLGFSQAEHHTRAGHLVVTLDLPGIGQNLVENSNAITTAMLARACDRACRIVVQRLEEGSLAPSLPGKLGVVAIGIGHSLGGAIILQAQAQCQTFAGIALLGRSVVDYVIPQNTPAKTEAVTAAFVAWQRAGRQGTAPKVDFRHFFYWETDNPMIVEADIGSGFPARAIASPFGSATVPPCSSDFFMPGALTGYAAAVSGPVFLGFGERDAYRSLTAEVAAFRKARSVTTFSTPQAAHMHNVSGNREVLWTRLVDWYREIARGHAPAPQSCSVNCHGS
jgi:pimeloyl-ACP methyl ester carboxylesterase